MREMNHMEDYSDLNRSQTSPDESECMKSEE